MVDGIYLNATTIDDGTGRVAANGGSGSRAGAVRHQVCCSGRSSGRKVHAGKVAEV